MPLKPGLRKVMVIGSGPIIIGQAAEFDYAGTQACRALKEEGMEVILLNTNPATIMTDTDIADQVYFEPITTATVSKILALEKPDGIIVNLGGQVGLNIALSLHKEGILEQTGIPVLGMPIDAIARAEDRAIQDYYAGNRRAHTGERHCPQCGRSGRVCKNYRLPGYCQTGLHFGRNRRRYLSKREGIAPYCCQGTKKQPHKTGLN